MTFQLVLSRTGKLRGIAILVGDGHIEAGRDQETPWRICDSCLIREAIVFCLTDNVYVCEQCLPRHTMPGYCKFLSVSAARDVSTSALTGNPLEDLLAVSWRAKEARWR